MAQGSPFGVRLILVLATFTLVQGCKSSGGGGGSPAPATSAEEGSGTPDSSGGPIAAQPTPEPTPTPEPEPGCTDDKGNFHLEGSSWVETSELPDSLACSPSSEDMILLEKSVKLTCHEGAIIGFGETIRSKYIAGSCSPVSIGAVVEPMTPAQGASTSIKIESGGFDKVEYACVDESTGQPVKAGQLAEVNGTINVNANTDLKCYVRATDGLGQQTVVSVDVDVECGNKIKVGGKCENFECKKFLPIAPNSNGRIDAPARTAEGICYSMKIADAIGVSNSALTGVTDMEVISRNHDRGYGNSSDLRNPYYMGGTKVDLMIRGPRTVRLAGSSDSLGPILVDNFVLRGLYPKGVAPDVSYYQAYGTSDATVRDTGAILLKDQPVPLKAFATGGTSTVEPLDLTTSIGINKAYTLDLRALDCGGSRHLSDLYLVFQ